MALLFLDCETTGLAKFSLPPDHPSQPRLCQLACILASSGGEIITGVNLLIRPSGWTIPPELTAIHSITTEDCERYGVGLLSAIDVLDGLARGADKLVAHNVKFDAFILEGECLRLRVDRPLVLAPHRHFCTQLAATPYCQIPKANGNSGWKWPKLGEAYRHFFGCEMEQAHRAGADVKACMKIYFAIQSAAAVAAVAR